ncbi:hypothetical protein Taro_034980 [Colocasia esculenta]|uniref:RRM domain-containing protein n=1 Tax=Colocasia esculenta TaxID=4460 RepID=A0A843W4F9_COLES|nr:hypothetical protein [Colocasia esculenta]
MAAPSASPPAAAPTKLSLHRTPGALASPSSLRFASPLPPPFLSPAVSISSPHSQSPLFALVLGSRQRRASKVLSVLEVNQAAAVAKEEEVEGRAAESGEERQPAGAGAAAARARGRPYELYVCNMPRSCDISDLLDIFSPYGTVQSVEVSRNPQTGDSRGCGFVTMSSILEAKGAMAALDGSELGGREMRVKFSADMVSGRNSVATLSTDSRKVIFYEGPHKVYVGNLSWFIQPEDLREYFSQFGTVVSVKLFRDKKSGKTRVYGFLSFSNVEEAKAAVSSTGKEFHGRPLLVREVVGRE